MSKLRMVIVSQNLYRNPRKHQQDRWMLRPDFCGTPKGHKIENDSLNS